MISGKKKKKKKTQNHPFPIRVKLLLLILSTFPIFGKHLLFSDFFPFDS